MNYRHDKYSVRYSRKAQQTPRYGIKIGARIIIRIRFKIIYYKRKKWIYILIE